MAANDIDMSNEKKNHISETEHGGGSKVRTMIEETNRRLLVLFVCGTKY